MLVIFGGSAGDGESAGPSAATLGAEEGTVSGADDAAVYVLAGAASGPRPSCA